MTETSLTISNGAPVAGYQDLLSVSPHGPLGIQAR
jgi:hypothetical protein